MYCYRETTLGSLSWPAYDFFNFFKLKASYLYAVWLKDVNTQSQNSPDWMN